MGVAVLSDDSTVLPSTHFSKKKKRFLLITVMITNVKKETPNKTTKQKTKPTQTQNHKKPKTLFP